jgi:hypothetical protein
VSNLGVEIPTATSLVSDDLDEEGAHESPVDYIAPYLCSSNLSSLLDCAKLLLATEDYLTIVLVREEYDMFANYLCHLQLVFEQSPYLPVLVLTDNPHLQEMVFPFGIIFFDICVSLADWEVEMDTVLRLEDRLQICRLRLSMELLQIGINVVLNDVDSIWLSNPFVKLPFDNKASLILSHDTSSTFNIAYSSNIFDIAYLLEKKQVLLSFLITRASFRSLFVWEQIITSLHMLYNESYHSSRDSLPEGAKNGGYIKEESEFSSFFQRVLEYFLVSNHVTRTKSMVKLFVLPSCYFSSAYFYYLQRSTVNTAAVVVNNYVAGGEYTKFYRLVKYNQWLFIPSSNLRPPAKALSSLCYHSKFCASKASHSHRHPFHRRPWKIFSAYSYPGFDLAGDIIYVRVDSPVHNQVINKDEQIHGFAVVEGNTSFVSGHGNRRDHRVSPIDTYFNSEPLYGFSRSADYQVSSPKLDYNMSSFSFLVPSTSLQISVDVLFSSGTGPYCPRFGVDYSNCSLEEAEANILMTNAVCRKSLAVETLNSHDSCGFVFSPRLKKEISQIISDEDSPLPSNINREISYSIKILAYNRLASLQRLLSSLISADYRGYRNISLEILVDRSPSSLVQLGCLCVLCSSFVDLGRRQECSSYPVCVRI